MQYKNITILLSLSLLFGNISITAMMKRKFKEEKEKEVEYIPEEKKLKKTEEIEIDPTKKQPKRLVEQTAQRFINSFLAEENIQKIEELKDQFNNLIPEMKEYITELINQPNVAGNTRLHVAQTPEQVKKLLFLGADPKLVNKTLFTPDSNMFIQGFIKAAETLFDETKTEPITNFHNFYLRYALRYDLPHFVKRILQNPANQQEIANERDYALLLAASYSPHSIPLLLEVGSNINGVDQQGRTPIFRLVENQNATPADIDFMIKKGANIFFVDNFGRTVLFHAVMHRNFPLIPYLVANKVDPNQKGLGETGVQEAPLEYAFFDFENAAEQKDYKNIDKIVQTIITLFKVGADIPAIYKQIIDPTGLVYPTPYGINTDFLEALIDYGANINVHDTKSYTLANALFNDDNKIKPENELEYDLIKLLVKKGAKITQKDKDLIMQLEDYDKLKELVKNAQIFDL